MFDVILTACSFFVCIILGYMSKKMKLVSGDGNFIGNIVMTFTLPCALIVGFNGATFSYWMIIALLIGLVTNIIAMFFGKYITGHKQTREAQASYILNCSGFSIGNLAIPFCLTFLPSTAIGYLAMFDIGNSIICLGGSAAYASSVLDASNKTDIKAIIKRLLSAIPVDTYFVLLLLSIFHITLPKTFITLISPVASANMFLMMFMVGLQLEFVIDKAFSKGMFKIFVSRLFLSLVFTGLFMILPLDSLLKKTLIIAVFAPIAGATIIFATELKAQEKLCAMMSSLTMIFSLFVYVLLMIILV